MVGRPGKDEITIKKSDCIMLLLQSDSPNFSGASFRILWVKTEKSPDT